MGLQPYTDNVVSEDFPIAPDLYESSAKGERILDPYKWEPQYPSDFADRQRDKAFMEPPPGYQIVGRDGTIWVFTRWNDYVAARVIERYGFKPLIDIPNAMNAINDENERRWRKEQ